MLVTIDGELVRRPSDLHARRLLPVAHNDVIASLLYCELVNVSKPKIGQIDFATAQILRPVVPGGFRGEPERDAIAASIAVFENSRASITPIAHQPLHNDPVQYRVFA